MATVTIEPATAPRFDDAEHALSGGGDGRSCQCQWWTITNAEFQQSSVDEKRELFRTEMDSALPPGLIAYVDGDPAGWVRVGPRNALARIPRTREIAGATAESFDDDSVWSVSCFVVRSEHRGEGLNVALLEAAIAFARENGARVIEAYPIDPTAAKKSSNQLFRGILSVFLGEGFREVARPKPDRAVVTLTL